jgi:hypothetical protein
MDLLDLFVKIGVKDEASAEVDKVAKNTESKISTAAKVGIAALAGAAVAVGKAAVEAYDSIEAGVNNVKTATGLTGDAADDLVESYEKVAANVSGSFEDIGSALGELNTRFGTTGELLEEQTEQIMKYAKVTGQDATSAVQSVAKMMNNAGIASDQLSTVLDELTVAGQASGISVDTLAQSVNDNATTMKELGFSTEDSIAMLATFEKEGANTSTILAGMKKGMQNWTKEGKSAKQGFQDFVDGVADGSVTAQDAIELFGSKAGVAMYDAAQKGQLDFSEMYDSIVNDSAGALDDIYSDTQTLSDKIDILKKKLEEKLAVFVEPLIDKITEFVDKMDTDYIPAIENFIDQVEPYAPIIAGVVAAFAAWESITTAVSVAQGILNAVLAANPIVLIISLIAALVAALVTLYNTNATFRAVVDDTWNSVTETVGGAAEKLNTFFTVDIPTSFGVMFGFFESLPGIVSGAVNSALAAVVQWEKDMETKAYETGAKFKAAVVTKFNEVIDWFRGLPERISAAIGDLGNTLYNAGKSVIEGFKKGILEKWESAKTSLTNITAQIPNLKGPMDVDKKLLEPNGIAIIDGLFNGFEEAWNKSKSKLSDFTSAISSDFTLNASGGASVGKTVNYYIDGINVNATSDGAFAEEFVNLMMRYKRLGNA